VTSLEKQKGWHRAVLRHGGQKHQKALQRQDEGEALRLKSRIEDYLRLLERGRLEFPGGDLITFLLADGKLNAVPSIRKAGTLGQMLDEYEKARTQDKEASTARTETIHFGHFRRPGQRLHSDG
jgi:hypothetical protein